MRIDGYSGPAKIVQPGGIEVDVQCRYAVDQQQVPVPRGGCVPGLVSWSGTFTSPDLWSPDPVHAIDWNLDAELLLPDGKKGSILIQRNGTFKGTGLYLGQEADPT